MYSLSMFFLFCDSYLFVLSTRPTGVSREIPLGGWVFFFSFQMRLAPLPPKKNTTQGVFPNTGNLLGKIKFVG